MTLDQKHQILLPAKHHLTESILNYEHIKNNHAGPQLLLSILRQKFWIINGKLATKQTVRKCIRCFKNKPSVAQQSMGQLPPDRIQPSRPFSICGVDYAGPFITIQRNQRGVKSIKSYVAIFICFSTRAVHIEVISDLTTESFIAALKRFISRRGKCYKMYSDNGSNFVGAHNEMKEMKAFLTKDAKNNEISSWCTTESILWQFIPPRSPHFGGLWEAGVKAFKHHFRRVAANARLTFEELTTLSVQIECCLNSRPISPMSDDPNEMQPLTPAHFLTGTSMLSISEPDLQEINSNRLSRWQHVTQMVQSIWSRWSKEYLHTLQQQSKWNRNIQNLTTGALVLIKDDNLPPTKWLLGRIMTIFPGADNRVRVVDVKTMHGILQRSIHHLCPLPTI